MTSALQTPIPPASAAVELATLGFLAHPDLPDRPGHAYLLVAIRDRPTLHHYDPERLVFWESRGGCGRRVTVDRHTPLPLRREFSWGTIVVVDRLSVPNRYLTFGGEVVAADIEGASVFVFESPVPLLRGGGHSQGWDHGAQSVNGFFARLMIAVDYAPGVEAAAAAASPEARYAAFVADEVARLRRSEALRAQRDELWVLLRAEEQRIKAASPETWQAGLDLLEVAGLTPA